MESSDLETSGMADIFDTAEFFETFATLRLMLAGTVGVTVGPVGGAMAWIWTHGWQDVGDFGQFADVDILFSFFL